MTTSSLVGREFELARLREAVAAAQAGAGGVVLVTGEAGIGKTSLVAVTLPGSGSACSMRSGGRCGAPPPRGRSS